MGIADTEFHIMADHDYGHALTQQVSQNPRKAPLKFRVQPLCGLVQQQNFRLQQQHLRQSSPLLFSTGQIIGVPVPKLLQPAQANHPAYARLPLLRRNLGPLKDLRQVLPDGFLDKQGLWILGQGRQRAVSCYGTPIRLLQGPDRSRKVVVFPVPLPPKMAKNSPRRTVSCKPFTTSGLSFSYRNHASCTSNAICSPQAGGRLRRKRSKRIVLCKC